MTIDFQTKAADPHNLFEVADFLRRGWTVDARLAMILSLIQIEGRLIGLEKQLSRLTDLRAFEGEEA